MKIYGVVLIVLAVAVAVFSNQVARTQVQVVEPDQIVSANIQAANVEWQASKGIDRLVLSISVPGGSVLREEYAAGSELNFRLVDKLGEPRPDGQYAYEMRVTPWLDHDTRQALATARQTGSMSIVEDLKQSGKLPSEPVIESGYFSILQGAIVEGGATESPVNAPGVMSSPLADQVILDDLIVDGSACIGFDCVNGESFGFDTIRLKENNLRIRFVDTSSSASFPSNDWQITANDSSNGGANKFSIDDIDGAKTPFTIEAGARTNSLYVDDGGRIGIGTNTPVVTVHTKTGNTPTLRLDQDGSSGFTPQTWDVAGNEAGFFVRDATNGSTLPFRIRPGAPSSALDIEGSGSGSGQIGLGTGSPAAHLHLRRGGPGADGLPRIRFENTDATDSWNIDVADNDVFRISEDGSGGTEFEIDTNGNVTIQSGDGVGVAGEANLTVTGTIVSGGGGTCDPGPCDDTFQPDKFEVPTIEEHAEFMWMNSYLWGVGPTEKGAPINLTEKTTGLLHELEVAHIYIDQLNARLTAMEESLGFETSSDQAGPLPFDTSMLFWMALGGLGLLATLGYRQIRRDRVTGVTG